MHDKHLNYSTRNAAKSVISTFAVSQEKNTPIENSELQTLHLLKLSDVISEGPNIIFTISDLMKQSSVRIKAPTIKLRPYAIRLSV